MLGNVGKSLNARYDTAGQFIVGQVPCNCGGFPREVRRENVSFWFGS